MSKNILLCLILISSSLGVSSEKMRFLRVPLSNILPNLNPTEAEDFVTIRVLMNLGMGLTSLDKNLKVIPGLAEKWTVSENGTVVTFNLAPRYWSNKNIITSNDFLRAFKSLFSPETKAKVGIPLLSVIKNANKFKNKEIQDFSTVGVEAPSPDKLILRLNYPAPFIMSLLALPICFPHPQDNYLIKEGALTSGPFTLKTFNPSREIILTPNANFQNPPTYGVQFKVIEDSQTALSLFRKNEVDVVEKLPGPSISEFENRSSFRRTPLLATYYLGFRMDRSPFDKLSLRKAIAKSIDRSKIDKIMLDKQIPASSWVPTPLEGSQKTYGWSFDPKEAAKIWNETKDAPREITLFFDAQEKNKLIGELLQKELENALKIKVRLQFLEWKSYINKLGNDKPSFFRFGWLTAFPDPLSHLEIFTGKNPNNYTGFNDKGYDELVAKISMTAPGPERSQLIDQAQGQLLTENVVILPLFHYLQYHLINPRWTNLNVTSMGLINLFEAVYR